MSTKIVRVVLKPKTGQMRGYKESSFKLAMEFPLKFARFFGFFPPSPAIRHIKFFVTWRMLYSFITFSLFLFEFATVILQQIRIDSSKKNILMYNAVVFHVGGLLQFILVFKTSLEWPKLVQKWDNFEKSMSSYECHRINLCRRIKMITISIISLAAAEHVLVNAYKLKISFQVERTSRDAFRNYFKYASYSHVFEIVDYSYEIGIILQFMNLQRTFNWNFVDVFIMLIGTALSFRLKQIRKKVKLLINLKIGQPQVWKQIRNDYIKCTQLITEINDRISYLICISFFLNLYFVVFQLFGSFKPFNNTIERLYFCISFGLLLTRLICVCYFGGEVFEEWNYICFVLNSVKSSAYNEEVERFIYHVKTCQIVLGGKHLFSITRNLLLKVAGMVVTYELVLIQFNLDLIRNEND